MSGKSRTPIMRHQDFTFSRDGTIVQIRVISAAKLVYYRTIRQGPYFLEDMAQLRAVWTKGPEWQFLPWPR